mgnify:CR=1 FL=1
MTSACRVPSGFSPEAFESAITAPLFPLRTPIAELPVGGYSPDWVERPRPAAVLLGITSGPGPGVVLTLRARALQHHAGQVSFPGGARELPGESVVETALREAREEAGIERHLVKPLGYLGRYDTISGYRMTAVVALLAEGASLCPDCCEVDEVFTVPLTSVTDPDCYRHEKVRHAGRTFDIVTLDHPDHHIWGATAALLHEYGTRLGSLSG